MAGDLPETVRAALTDYLSRLETGAETTRFPRFRRAERSREPATTLDLPLDEEASKALALEAARQQVSMAHLLQHVVLVYLADLDVEGSDQASERPLR